MILVINCGSSSLKFALMDREKEEAIVSGLAEKLGQTDAVMTIQDQQGKIVLDLVENSHQSALAQILNYLEKQTLKQKVTAIGHRVVHGGEMFKAATLINEAVLQDINACMHLAPLHNPANLLGIKAALAAFPHLPHVAVFDTAFHQTMPKVAYLYAVPVDWYVDHGVRRYGFHGTSHRYVTMRAANKVNIPLDNSAFISVHLGNGASVAAVLNGQSVDTSMGLTPLEGLVMGTRSGDVDPGLHAYIANKAGLTLDEINAILNKESGLFGLSGLSNDCRELEAAAQKGHEGALLALDIFAFRVAKYIGALSTNLPRIDALIFTGGIGENAANVRSNILARLRILGFKVDEDSNNQCVKGRAGCITKKDTPCALVINTNEEWMIAQDTIECIENP